MLLSISDGIPRNTRRKNMIILMFLLLPSTTLSHNFPIAKPGCTDSCGGVSIPYPFGTTPECYQDYSFWVTCNSTSNPPKLLLQNSSIEVTHISLDGQVKIMHYIAQDCYLPDGTQISNNNAILSLAPYLTVNSTANKFTIVGCDTYGFISGQRFGRSYMTGCTAMCDYREDVTEGSCTGSGCCQTSIPADVWEVKVDLLSYDNYTYVSDFESCGYAFLVEESAFRFYSDNLTNLDIVERVPLVLDWGISNGTCEEAQTNTSSYACVSADSGCYKPANGYGYRCRCRDGFQGSAYVVDGCQDIDECGTSDLHECMEKASCINTVGNYTCSCPKGYTGDGRGPKGCKDINECGDATLHDCMKNEYCTNTEGNYTCSCPKGFSGDGRGKHGCSKKHYTKTAYILIGVAFGTTLLLVAAIFWYMEFKRRSSKAKRQKFFRDNGGVLLQQKLTTRQRSPDTVKIFTSTELEKATNSFHTTMIVGQGGFGTVYRGELSDKTTVAIKKSKKVDPAQIDQFINEVFVLSQVNHRNVVRLLGCCLETEAPLLVYEFITNGTLSSHVHNKSKSRLLKWEARLKIATETAGVLSYLHSAISTPIIHRDVKTDNILLDQTCTAKVSDFGASKLVPSDLTQLSTMVQGTFGYLDPEYLQTNQLTDKSDVYSFGVVLLELLTGRKAISFDKAEEEKNLANFFLSKESQGCLGEILDENIVGDPNRVDVMRVSRLAKACLNVRGADRPSMKEVAMELEGLILGGKHSWDRNDQVEMKDMFLDEEKVDVFVDGDEEKGKNRDGFDRIWGHFFQPIKGGRWKLFWAVGH